MKRPTLSFFAGCVLVFSLCALAAAQPASRSVAPSSGKALCSALTPADFTKAGVPVSALDQANLDGNDGAYCVYQSKAGKVEFDIFFLAGNTPKEVSATEQTVLGEGGGKFTPVQLAGADSAQISLSLADQPASACIVVRRGKAVFDIVIPRGAQARQQLLDLAQIVLSRLKQ
ncbi:MAG: hypothetical protein LAO20_13675 [Acidobacteriia bacterium]|nr:hypothetical protein [Terriglobia bacterium]